MRFKVIAGLILAVYYGAYIVKLCVQIKAGVTIGHPSFLRLKNLHFDIDFISEAAALIAFIAGILSIIFVAPKGVGFLQFIGAVIAVAGTVIFILALKAMGNNWRIGIDHRHKADMVTGGVYSFSRNPAFAGFDLMSIGILIMFFNWGLLAATIFAVAMRHLQMLREERHMTNVYGMEYIAYRNRVMRYAGRRSRG